MIWLRIWAVAMMLTPTTCVADRVGRLERQMRLLVKSLQSYVDVRIDTIEGEFGSLTDRVLKLESLVNAPDNDSVDIDSYGPRTWHTKGISYTKSELNDIKNTLTMYEHSFSKQKKEMIDVNYVVKDTFAVFLSNASSAVNSLVNTVSDHVQHSTDNISATLEKVNNTLVESGRLLRSDILTYLSNISSEGKIDMIMRFEEEKQEHNNTLFTLNSRVLHHIANETESLEIFKTNLLKDVYAARENVQNETIEMEKKVEDLIGKANEVVGNIDEQRSTIEDGIMVTIRALHSFWSDWSAWSDCSHSCDRGIRTRNRICDVNPPLNDSICIGNETATEECVIHEYCPFDGGWSLWGSFGQCDVTCGNGTMTRDRTCDSRALENDGDECQGDKEQTTTCVMNQCPVDGGWSGWSLWGSCSSTCGIGMQRRDRTCDNPLPSKDGNHCFGDSDDNRMCTDIQCPVGWSSWSGWTSCSVTCGTGLQKRSRSCQNPMTSLINDSCSGDQLQFQTCTDKACSSAFTATGYAPYGSGSQIRFPNVILNEGNDYNSATGVFTCRVPGLYLVTATIGKYWTLSVDYVPCYIQLNGSNKLYLYHDPHGDDEDGYTSSATGTFRLHLYDGIRVGGCSYRESIYDSTATSFSAVLIRPDQL